MGANDDEDDLQKLKDLVTDSLDSKGVLSSIKAQLRKHVFEIIDDQEENTNSIYNTKTPCTLTRNPLDRFLFDLCHEYLTFYQLDYTGWVFEGESQVNPPYADRNKIHEKFPVDINPNKTRPLLYSVIEAFLAQNNVKFDETDTEDKNGSQKEEEDKEEDETDEEHTEKDRIANVLQGASVMLEKLKEAKHSPTKSSENVTDSPTLSENNLKISPPYEERFKERTLSFEESESGEWDEAPSLLGKKHVKNNKGTPKRISFRSESEIIEDEDKKSLVFNEKISNENINNEKTISDPEGIVDKDTDTDEKIVSLLEAENRIRTAETNPDYHPPQSLPSLKSDSSTDDHTNASDNNNTNPPDSESKKFVPRLIKRQSKRAMPAHHARMMVALTNLQRDLNEKKKDNEENIS